jgi:hypothetical protein
MGIEAGSPGTVIQISQVSTGRGRCVPSVRKASIVMDA